MRLLLWFRLHRLVDILKTKSVCLIVDNPLRDLNGLILLAYQLVKRGMDVWLVPMYEQWNEIQAIRPDAVMVNYLRENNRNHVISYLRAGMMVGVLETEGVGGRSLNEYRQLVSTTGCTDLLDLYFLWGSSQKTALLEEGVIPESIAKVTGCPRYDFCATPWRHLLERRESRPYILINTSFPTANPRFSAGQGAEIAAMVAAGFSAEFAAEYIDAARGALIGMVGLLEELAVRFPDRLFVLRPHPFESPEGYRSLRRFPNLVIRQEGTSLEWVAHADALIHLNCSTAVEASMLGVAALSPSWLDASPLHVPLASDLSQHYVSVQYFVTGLRRALADKEGGVAQRSSRAIEDYYFRVDGKASSRVADAIAVALASRGVPRNRGLPKVSFRFKAKALVKSILGSRLFHVLFRRRTKIAAKSFTAQQVGVLLASIGSLDGKHVLVTNTVGASSPGDRSSVLVRAA